MQSGCAAAEHHVRGACRGGSLSVCALDVGAFDFLLNNFGSDGAFPPLRFFQSSGRIIAGGGRCVKCEIEDFVFLAGKSQNPVHWDGGKFRCISDLTLYLRNGHHG
jgi:hypothetical protein